MPMLLRGHTWAVLAVARHFQVTGKESTGAQPGNQMAKYPGLQAGCQIVRC